MIRRVAVLTGANLAPGMNAAIRSVTRTALQLGWEVKGICDGYTGLLRGDFISLTARSVEGIIQRGGSMLGGLDSDRFSTEIGRRHALDCLGEHGIDALIVIGDMEAQTDASALAQLGFQVNGIATSVENDLPCFDWTLGLDTALNIALDSIDHEKMTRSSDAYPILIEVAGHSSGYLALVSAIASGAEAIVIPEVPAAPEQIEDMIRDFYDHDILHPIIVVAEGAAYNADRLAHYLAHDNPWDRRVRQTKLAHIQRHAAPNAFDRLFGTRLGVGAVHALSRGEHGVLVSSLDEQIRTMPLAEVLGKTKAIDADMIKLASVFAVKVPVASSTGISASQ